MNRHIDVDVLVKWICGNKCGCERNECGYDIPCQQVQLLEGAPSIDIVRCGECKHRGICFGRLVQGTEVVQLNFCSHGEREGE